MGNTGDDINEYGLRVGIGAGLGGLIGVIIQVPTVIILGFIITLPIIVLMAANTAFAAYRYL